MCVCGRLLLLSGFDRDFLNRPLSELVPHLVLLNGREGRKEGRRVRGSAIQGKERQRGSEMVNSYFFT